MYEFFTQMTFQQLRVWLWTNFCTKYEKCAPKTLMKLTTVFIRHRQSQHEEEEGVTHPLCFWWQQILFANKNIDFFLVKGYSIMTSRDFCKRLSLPNSIFFRLKCCIKIIKICPLGVNFTNVQRAAFVCTDPESAKKDG